MQRITFGTSGWRGIMCEDFIFDNVKVVTQAIADNVKAAGEADKGIVVSYDSRFMGEQFAREAARVLTGAGIRTFLCVRDTPTPVIAFEILRRKTAGAINFTASHNPPRIQRHQVLTLLGRTRPPRDHRRHRAARQRDDGRDLLPGVPA